MAGQPDASQVIAGPALIYVAPVGTAAPTTTILFPSPWFQVGYTDAGVDFIYTPTIKEEYVDEEAAPVLDILEKEKAVVQAHLAESNLVNLSLAISASTLTYPTLGAGSQALTYVAIGVVGPAPNGNNRVITFAKAITTVGVSLKFTRKAKQVIPVSWDARKIAGQNLFNIFDVGAGFEGS